MDIERVRGLVMKYGWNATSYQLVNPGIQLWWCPEFDAVIGYVRRKRVRVVAGAPVCPNNRLREVVAKFESEAKDAGDSVCYFGAAGRIMGLLGRRPGYSYVVLGGQPVWRPVEWDRATHSDASLRAQFNRATNKGVRVVEWAPEHANNHVDLRRCLEEWLETRGLPPLHFLVEPETIDRLEGRRVFVAERKGEVVGFLILSPVPARKGWLTEQFIRGKKAPNGTVELMMDAAVKAVAADGSLYVTMGLVPLARHGSEKSNPNPVWLRGLLAWVRAHGRRFYNFDGLETFKAKFHPESWENIYAISNEPTFSYRSLYAIAAAFCDGSPIVAIGRGLVRAVKVEVSRLFVRR